ncbi:MAG TPA: TIM barrel protein [Sedimentisphaerales bacterium]|nr:TIM barrel protein [Sedimentisphaerales bacterium]
MIPVSVCLETVFTDMTVEDRIAKIAEAGYKYVEFWHPEGTFDGKGVQFSKAKDAASMKKACKDNGIKINDFAMHAWDGSIGGCPVKAEDHKKYFVQIQKMIDFAKSVGCDKGIILSGTVDKNLTHEQMRKNLLKAFKKVTKMAEAQNFTLLIEPLNTLVDHPGYFLDCPQAAADIIREINSPNLKLLFDVYHMQIMQGNIIAFIEKNIDIIGHFHSAGVPGRAELFDTEVNYPAIMKKLDELGYKGCFGLEYFPKMKDHFKSLKKTLKYLQS